MTKEQHPNDIAYSKGYRQGVFDTEMRYQTITTPEATGFSRVGGNEEVRTITCRTCGGDGYTVEPSMPDGEPEQVQCNDCHAEGEYTTLDEVRRVLTTKDQEKEEAIAKARDQEAKLWFETWYSHYISPTKPLTGEFAKFATERIQMTGYERDQALPTEDNK